jgi:hypothetical protein
MSTQLHVAALVIGLSFAWNLLFFAVDTLPATVPVALALLITEAAKLSLPTKRPSTSGAACDGGAFSLEMIGQAARAATSAATRCRRVRGRDQLSRRRVLGVRRLRG